MTDAPSSASVENACRYNSKGRTLFGKTPSSLKRNCSGATNSCCLTAGWACICNAISRDKSEPVAFVNILIKLRVLRLQIASAWQTRSVQPAPVKTNKETKQDAKNNSIFVV